MLSRFKRFETVLLMVGIAGMLAPVVYPDFKFDRGHRGPSVTDMEGLSSSAVKTIYYLGMTGVTIYAAVMIWRDED